MQRGWLGAQCVNWARPGGANPAGLLFVVRESLPGGALGVGNAAETPLPTARQTGQTGLNSSNFVKKSGFFVKKPDFGNSQFFNKILLK